MRWAKPYELSRIDSYLSLDFNQFQILGRSIAGVETVFAIPQFNLTFDTGRAPSFAYAQDYLALTHCHMDHAGGLPYYLGLRCLNGLKPLKIIAPREKREELKTYLTALKHLSASELDYEVVEATDLLYLKKNLRLRLIPNFHCTPSTGYLVEEERKKLKLEFIGKTGDEIRALKEQGIEINDVQIEKVLAFSGDSTGKFLATEANQAKVLLMECTFFDEDVNSKKIEEYGHAHILDWKRFADQIESETVVMTHTSQRYTLNEIETACQKHLPSHLLRRLVIFRA